MKFLNSFYIKHDKKMRNCCHVGQPMLYLRRKDITHQKKSSKIRNMLDRLIPKFNL